MLNKYSYLFLVFTSAAMQGCNQDPVYVVEDPEIVEREQAQTEEIAALKQENETLQKENAAYEGQKEGTKLLLNSTYHKLLGTWSTESGIQICFFQDKASGDFFYAVNEELPKAATESAEANAEEKKPITDFAHGAFAVQWFKSGMSFTKENEELVQADRMMLNLRVNNGEQEATYNFLTELDYADQKKGFYANLPVTETKFLEKPNKSAYYTDLFLIKDKSGVDNSLLFTKKALKPLDGDQKYPTDPDALLQLVINQGAELCTF